MKKLFYILSLIYISINLSCSNRDKSIYRYEDVVNSYGYHYFIQPPCDTAIIQSISYNPDSMSYSDIYAYFKGKISPEDINNRFTNRITDNSIGHNKYEFGMDLENKHAANTDLYRQIYKYPFCEIHTYEWEINDPKSILKIYYIIDIIDCLDELKPIYATWTVPLKK